MGFLLYRRYVMLRTIDYPKFRRRRAAGHPVKLTALLYLKEALLRENYEICADVIATAKEFGAADFEVRDLLEDPRRAPS
jgi:hypothetical protein